ncbi:exosome complex exonuclease RRP6-like protein [Achlya hypogyna]|uniref:Exosome complex exonuclease RRP6-like protein n=1 Tax=Achlya hypogyna TaxID=1202772 RepID=A0A1V9YZK9_ACHHY|nr:exosome complex exonuclease RRP6-like protein [Achlya hypogyna]
MDLPATFVEGLYRHVLLGVKASNAIPSSEDEFHFHYKFNDEFRGQADALGGRVTALLHQIQSINNKLKGKEDDDVADFDPLEENGPLTDLVDSLLEDATKQIERFQKGEVQPAPAPAPVAAPVTTNAAISKPQDKFEDKIDNSDAPFVAKLKSKPHASTVATEHDNTGSDEPYHPYRSEITSLVYQPWQLAPSNEKREMIPLDAAAYTWVDTPEALEAMIASLSTADLLAIDLEHHSYRSYQGFLCLMQISTWDADWLVDTLALRSHLHTLNTIFCDPTKLKVLHGADMDVLWLQRDLGLYLVNMFDTGRAARCLQYPRFSLAYLLQTHCAVTADKQYQLADWRIRPLDDPLVKYAREDTRYLLYIYEVLKAELLKGKHGAQNLLLTTYAASATVALAVYEKPKVPTSDELLDLCIKLKNTVGLQTISASQHHLFEALYLWRDGLARRLDESPAYVCPNAVLMKLMTGAPATPAALFRLCNPVPPLVRKHAHELTVLIAREAAAEPAPAPVAAPKKAMAATALVHEENAQIYGFAGWSVPKRETTVATDATESPFATTFAAPLARDAEAALEQVRQALAQTAFVVVGFAPEPAPVTEVAVKVEQAPVEYVAPKALSENYPKLKKRKFESKTTKEAAAATAAINEATDGTEFKGFDYAAAAATVEASKMDVNAMLQKQEDDKRKKRRAGYNPFVGAAAGGGKDTVNQKRGYNAPRSSTFR